MTVIIQPPISTFNAVITDYHPQAKRVRTVHENQIRIARSMERAYPYGSLKELSDARRETTKRTRSKSPTQKPEWTDQEAKRKRRVAKYKRYETEGRVKSSVKEGLRTFKLACMKVVASLG